MWGDGAAQWILNNSGSRLCHENVGTGIILYTILKLKCVLIVSKLGIYRKKNKHQNLKKIYNNNNNTYHDIKLKVMTVIYEN